MDVGCGLMAVIVVGVHQERVEEIVAMRIHEYSQQNHLGFVTEAYHLAV